MFRLSNLLLSPKKAEKHPIEIIFVAFFYASISIFLGLWIFPDYVSLFMVFFTVISCLYIVEGIFIIEEKKEKDISSETWVLKQHYKTIYFLLFLFLGFLIAFTFWTIILPNNLSSQVFGIQEQAFTEIRSITGDAISQGDFNTILTNNLRVLLLSLILALFYGAGSVFILVWNASILGFVIGNLAKNILGLISLPHIFLKFFLHGIPEMIAYFIGSLAGGILFISIIRGDFKSGRIKRTLLDVFILVAISVLLLILAAFIEVSLSPII